MFVYYINSIAIPQVFATLLKQFFGSEERKMTDSGGGLRRVTESDIFSYCIKSIVIPQVSATLISPPQLFYYFLISY